MNCEELQRELSLYVDDELSPASRAVCDAHLLRCPICRHRLAQTRTLIRSLAQLSRPETPAILPSSIRDALAIESATLSAQQPVPQPHEVVLRWLRPRLMPYTVGAFTSVILFACLFAALLPYMRVLRELENNTVQGESFDGIYAVPTFDVTVPVSPALYASSRVDFSSESPSLNPRGALASLAWSRTRELTTDDEMIIVADVFSNGNAVLADVVLPPRNQRMIDDIQAAFRSSPAFVPASLDHRPQTMRVVLSIQRMDVHEQAF